mgnify:CR=1 FL=1
MKLKTIKGFELYNMDKPDPYNEKMQFRSALAVVAAQKLYGGLIRPCPVHVQDMGE